MNEVRVMQVVLSLRVGGLERVVVDLVNHASDEFRFVVCCLEEAGAWAGEVAHIVALDKRPGVDWRMFWRIARIARAEKIDVIHTHNSTAHFYGAIAGKLAGTKVLHTEHGKNVGEETRYHRLNRFAARFTDRTVTVSEQNAKIAVAHEGAKNPTVIPNGIRVGQFNAARNSPGRRIGSVGRLVREKNYPLLMRAVAKIPDAELVLVGDGPLRDELETLANEIVGQAPRLPSLHSMTAAEAAALQSGRRVRFLGQRADVADLLAGFDVFALSSSTEGMSIALLEAMAARCPIVVTAVGGNVELIQHMQTGLIVPPDDENALRTAIARLLDDRTLAARLGDAARKAAHQRYSVETMTRRYEELWRQLAAA